MYSYFVALFYSDTTYHYYYIEVSYQNVREWTQLWHQPPERDSLAEVSHTCICRLRVRGTSDVGCGDRGMKTWGGILRLATLYHSGCCRILLRYHELLRLRVLGLSYRLLHFHCYSYFYFHVNSLLIHYTYFLLELSDCSHLVTRVFICLLLVLV